MDSIVQKLTAQIAAYRERALSGNVTAADFVMMLNSLTATLLIIEEQEVLLVRCEQIMDRYAAFIEGNELSPYH